MKKILLLFVIPFAIFNLSAQNKSVTLYNNGITHDNIKAEIFNNDTTYIYSVTTAAMWTGALSTKIVYKGNYNNFMAFMIPLLRFAEENQNNKGAKEVINGVNIESTKKIGVKCISIGGGKDINNTTYNSIKEAVEAIHSWK